jgi:pimeloyl-ACP methyl ester carboxylesterase
MALVERLHSESASRAALRAADRSGLPMSERVFMADSQAPIAASTLSTPLTKAAWKAKPTWYLVAADDQVIPPEVQRDFAKRMEATTRAVASSHVAYVSHPQETAQLIADAAKAAGAK